MIVFCSRKLNKSGADVTSLQADQENITNWCDNWRMKLNIAKCKAMRVTRSSTLTHMYSLKGIPLQPVTLYKYLGVNVTNNLKWDMPIEHTTVHVRGKLVFTDATSPKHQQS